MMVLVVEEETHQREAIAAHLAQAGFDVCQAADTDAALALLRRRSDLTALVTDAHVPGAVDGHALGAQVRQRWPHIDVVVISGHSDDSAGPLPEGAAFVTKPFLFENLVPTLQRLSEKRST